MAAARIRATGFFSDVQVNPVQGSNPEQAVVDVQVEETTTGSLGFGLSYGASDGIGGNITYNEANFLGRGQALNLTFSTVSDARSLSMSLTEPALLGRDLALGLALGLSTTSANGSTTYFDTQVVQFSPSLTFPVSEFGRFSVRYSLNRTSITPDIATYPTSVAARVQSDAGAALTSSLGFTYAIDTRTNGRNPDSGYIFRFSQDIAGLGGDRRWARSTILAGYEHRVMNGDVRLSAEFEAGAVWHNSGASRITEQNTGSPIRPIRDRRQEFGSDYQDILGPCCSDKCVSHVERIHESTAGGTHIPSSRVLRADCFLHQCCGCRKPQVPRYSTDDYRIKFRGVQACLL